MKWPKRLKSEAFNQLPLAFDLSLVYDFIWIVLRHFIYLLAMRTHESFAIYRGILLELVKIRLKETKDEAFIYNSWLRSNRASHPNMPNSDYFEHYKAIITDLLYKSIVAIACDPNDPEFIYGYVVIRPIDDVSIIHWAYVKKPFRRFGVLKQLVKSQGLNLSEPILLTCKAPDYFKKYTLVYRPDLKKL